ncbi:MAG: molybdenum cofactor guanylyltransferase [Anaerolineae bacterium]|nr:MAG: molybdenum cofactor guanylyltransferase [Anaerolineae bacterium]
MLTVSIQAGGKSSRMGQDKALIPFRGQLLIERIIARVRPIADEIIITTNNPQAYRFLGLPLFTDIYPQRGALGGLHTALTCASHPFVAIVACDMPFVSPALIEFQKRILLDEKVDVVIPAGPQGMEPLHSLYRRETCLPACQEALLTDQWKLISWFPRVQVRLLQPEEIQPYDPHGLAFWNVNTPEEFHHAEMLATEKNE